MGRSVDAHLAYGFVLEEGQEPPEVNEYLSLYDLVDMWCDKRQEQDEDRPRLDVGGFGSLYGWYHTGVVYVSSSEHWVSWGAEIVTLPAVSSNWINELNAFCHEYLRQYPIEIGWVLWSLEG